MDLFYYTTTDTMSHILTGGNIYATNIRYMNDAEEYLNGLNEIYNLFKRVDIIKAWMTRSNVSENLLETLDNTYSERNLIDNKKYMEYYSISFCKKNDLLSQWAIYARESGVSIKMKFEKERYSFSSDTDSELISAEWKGLPQKVHYFTYDSMKGYRGKYKEAAFEILDQLYPEGSEDYEEEKKENWRYISALVKRYDFYQEEEYRLVFEPTKPVHLPKIKYRPDKMVLKPYLDIKCDNGWPIWEIMIGPGFNQQVVFDSVEHFLNHAEVKVGIEDPEADFCERIKEYLKPHEDELQECEDYVDLSKQLEAMTWEQDDFQGVKNYCCQKLNYIIQAVFEDNHYSSGMKNYFNEKHFTKSGVVLSKSSIPYIF